MAAEQKPNADIEALSYAIAAREFSDIVGDA